MPNWCNTSYKFIGDKEEVQDLYDKLIRLQTLSEEHRRKCSVALHNNEPTPEPPSDVVDSGFEFFLGTVVKAFGGDWEKIYCQGEVDNIEKPDDNMLQIFTTTAWINCPKVWDLVVSKYKTIEYFFRTEEPANGYLINSDTTGEYFPELYYIDQCSHDCEYATDDEELLEDIAKRLGVENIESFEQLDALLKAYNEKNEDTAIYYHKFSKPD